MYNDLFYEICSHYYLYTYIHHGHIWHRNKFSRCQLEPLVSCTNDEHQTSLKWDRSSHPVAPECRVSHTLRLKHFTVDVRSLSELCSCTVTVPAAWQASFSLSYWRSEKYPKDSNFWTSQNTGSQQVNLPQYSLHLGNFRHVYGNLKWYLPLFFLPMCTYFMLWVTFCLQISTITLGYMWPYIPSQWATLKTEHVSLHNIGNNVLICELGK